MSEGDSMWSDFFARMKFTPQQQAAADRQQDRGALRFLHRCMTDHDFNCDHYDPIAKLDPEARGRDFDQWQNDNAQYMQRTIEAEQRDELNHELREAGDADDVER